MGIERITEVGVVVRDVDEATKFFTDVLGVKVGQTQVVDAYKMRFRMCRIGDIDFELMEPTEDDGVISKFLESHGEGLHHIAFKVSNIEEALAWMKQKGIRLIDETPRVGLVGDLKIAFVHPKSCHGVMFELIQY